MAFIGLGKINRVFTGGPVSNPILLPNGSEAAPSLALANGTGTGIWSNDPGGSLKFSIGGSLRGILDSYNLVLYTVYGLSFNDTTYLVNDAANTLALKNGNNDQCFRIYGANGSYLSHMNDMELLTITTEANTDTTMTIPPNAIVKGVSCFVVTGIPTAANFTVTGAVTGTAFQTGASITSSSGSTDAGTKACPFLNTSSQSIRITPNAASTSTAGTVRIVAHYERIIPPTS